MKPNLTDTLCTGCGLCCDGSLFADVELASAAEVTALEAMGLEIEDDDEHDGPLLMQPCRALQGKRCTIYPHRPDCCRTFECRLFQEVKRGEVGVRQAKARIAEALRRIERLEGLIFQVGQSNDRLPLKERFAEALACAEEFNTHLERNRKWAELQAAMRSVEHCMQAVFLNG